MIEDFSKESFFGDPRFEMHDRRPANTFCNKFYNTGAAGHFSGSQDITRIKKFKDKLFIEIVEENIGYLINQNNARQLETLVSAYFGVWGPFDRSFWENIFLAPGAKMVAGMNGYVKYVDYRSKIVSAIESKVKNLVSGGGKPNSSKYCFRSLLWAGLLSNSVVQPGEFWLAFALNEYLGDRKFIGKLNDWLKIKPNQKKVDKTFETFNFTDYPPHTAKVFHVFTGYLFGSINSKLSAETFAQYFEISKEDWNQIFSDDNKVFFERPKTMNSETVSFRLGEIQAGKQLSIEKLNQIYGGNLFESFLNVCNNSEFRDDFYRKTVPTIQSMWGSTFQSNFQYPLQARNVSDRILKISSSLNLNELTCLLFGIKKPFSWISDKSTLSWILLEKFAEAGKLKELTSLITDYVLYLNTKRPSYDEWLTILQNGGTLDLGGEMISTLFAESDSRAVGNLATLNEFRKIFKSL